MINAEYKDDEYNYEEEEGGGGIFEELEEDANNEYERKLISGYEEYSFDDMRHVYKDKKLGSKDGKTWKRNDKSIDNGGEKYYNTTKRNYSIYKYDRSDYLKKCLEKSTMVDNNKKLPLLNFIITRVETHYPPKVISNLYTDGNGIKKRYPDNFLIKYGKEGNQYKDLIFVRGRTIPTEPTTKSKTVFAYINYKNPYGPKIYLESREGFENAIYSQTQKMMDYLDPEANVGYCKDGVDKFIRWIQNYMYTKMKSNNKGSNYINPSSILTYTYYENIPKYKTMWGRIPEPEEGGPNRYIIELTLTTKSVAKKFTSFFESDEYLNYAGKNIVPTIRTFECDFTFDNVWRFQHDIDFGCGYQTNNYKEMTLSEISDTFNTVNTNDTMYIYLDYDCISRGNNVEYPSSLARCTKGHFQNCIPLKISFDIEVNNPIDELLGIAFPTAIWTPTNYAKRYKALITRNDYLKISYCKNEMEARETTIKVLANTPKVLKLLSLKGIMLDNVESVIHYLDNNVVPKLKDTDQITVIAGVIRQKEKGKELKSEHGGFIFIWRPNNDNNDNNDIGWEEPSFNNIKKLNNFSNIDIQIFESEYKMLIGLLKYVHEKNPDFIGGHNILSFDIPYIIDRIKFLLEFDKNVGNGNDLLDGYSFGIIKGHNMKYNSYSFDRNNSQKTTFTVDVPGLSTFDSFVSCQHATFGFKSESYSLSYLMSQRLTYPESDIKMRKLEISIVHASKLWKKGGDGLAYFAGYCLYDALGSIMLMELYNMFATMYFISEISGATPDSIYLRGAQNIVITMFYKMLWLSSKEYLFPDYGIRELHFPDLWYAHYDTHFEYKDVRYLYENVPSLKRKWEMGGLRNIPKNRTTTTNNSTNTTTNNNTDNNSRDGGLDNVNPYIPELPADTDWFCYSVEEIKKKKKAGVISKSKAYMGALVFEVLRGYYGNTFILTSDFLSMYPTTAEACCLDFPNLVTEFMKRIFNIPRITLMKIVLGPKSLIQMGDVCKDKELAENRGIVDSDEIVYTYYYQNTNLEISILPRMIDFLLASRQEAKNVMALWAFQVGRLTFLIHLLEHVRTFNNIYTMVGEKETDNSNLESFIKDKINNFQEKVESGGLGPSYGGKRYFKFVESILKNDITIIKNGNGLVDFIEKIVYESENKSDSQIYIQHENEDLEIIEKIKSFQEERKELLTKMLDRLINRLKIYLYIAIVEYIIYNTDQNSKKLTMNSAYGVVSMNGKFPQIHLGSSITALCRSLIERGSVIIENTDLIDLAYKLKLEKKIEPIIGKKVSSLRRGCIGKIYNPIITNGDTDSAIYALRDELFPCPETKDVVREHIGPYIARQYNTFLPKLYNNRYHEVNVNNNNNNGEICVVNDKMNGIMQFQAEKTSYKTLITKKKMYIQMTYEEKSQYKGVASKKSDTHPEAARLEKYAVNNFLLKTADKANVEQIMMNNPQMNRQRIESETTREMLINLLSYLRSEILKLFHGNYNPSDFRMKTKLNRPVESYQQENDKKLPIHVRVAVKKIERGEQVNVGEYISYLFILDTNATNFSNTKINRILGQISNVENSILSDGDYKNGNKNKKPKSSSNDEERKKLLDMTSDLINNLNYKEISDNKNVDDAKYVLQNNIPLDILFYLEFKIFPKIVSFMAPLLYSYMDYPRVPFKSTKNEKSEIKKEQKKIEKVQSDMAYNILTCGEIKKNIDILQSYKLQRALLKNCISSNNYTLPDNTIHRCVQCLVLFSKSSKHLTEDPVKLYNFINEISDSIGFFDICNDCSKKGKDELISKSNGIIKKSTEEIEKCDGICWSCIKKAGVTIKSSSLDRNDDKMINENYYLNPSNCTMDMCDIYKTREKHNFIIGVEKKKVIMTKDLDW